MKYLIVLLAAISFNTASCQKRENAMKKEQVSSDKITIIVGSQVFTATLYDNETSRAFKDLLPLKIEMTELNGNEKYYDLPNSLPQNSANPGQINRGDLMLYGSKTVVLFYKTFSTSYNYTRIGKLDDANGIADALGSGNKIVKFEIR